MDDDYYGEDGEEYMYGSGYSGNRDLAIIHENPDDEEKQNSSKKSSPEDGITNIKTADLKKAM